MARDQRRLAAIVSADVAGYSRLMGRDESGTLAALKAHRRELIDPKIAEYGGRIVKTTGDGLLLEFPSVVEAVRCAVDVQRGMAERNAGVAADHRIEFRVGVNVGDIIIDGEDIYGDGVNVAARLQTLAEPGSICVSRAVRDQVMDKLNFAFEDLGAQHVKNIARPIEAYRVALGGTSANGRIRPAQFRRWPTTRWTALSASLVVMVIVLPALIWWHSQRDSTPRPPALSVAVLPFRALGGSAADQRSADALASNVATILGRDYWTRGVTQAQVVAGTELEAQDPVQLGRSLHVRYLVKGEVHREGDKAAVLV